MASRSLTSSRGKRPRRSARPSPADKSDPGRIHTAIISDFLFSRRLSQTTRNIFVFSISATALRHFQNFCLLALFAGFATACTTSQDDDFGVFFGQNEAGAGSRSSSYSNRRPVTFAKAGTNGGDQSVYYPGTGQTVGQGMQIDADPALQSGRPVTVNLANASIDAAAKAVLGDVLGLNYTVAPNLGGSITIQTSNPVARTELIKLFQGALAANGMAIVRTGRSYRIDNAERLRDSYQPSLIRTLAPIGVARWT